MYYVGIDGGGTSTRVELRDAQNRLVARRKYGAFNISSIGEEGFRQLIRQIGSCEQVKDWAALCIGGAGVSYAGLEDMIREELSAFGFGGRLRLCSDFVIALRGAMDGPGAILIAGTGSVGYGENGKLSARVGGWGHLIDDDGSGYALGRYALATAVRHADGRVSAEMLYNEVLQHINGSGIRDILNYVYFSGRGKAEIATLAPCVLRCAERQDPAALYILRQTAKELREIAVCLGRRLELPRPRLALLGGLMTEGCVFRAITEEALSDVAEVIPAAHDALWGAACLAWEMRNEST